MSSVAFFPASTSLCVGIVSPEKLGTGFFVKNRLSPCEERHSHDAPTLDMLHDNTKAPSSVVHFDGDEPPQAKQLAHIVSVLQRSTPGWSEQANSGRRTESSPRVWIEVVCARFKVKGIRCNWDDDVGREGS